jgi:REP element-mobilizing transposase RayT
MEAQQEFSFRTWGGARDGAGRKRVGPRSNVPHRTREKFRKGTLHVTLRLRREVWSLRTHRCFRALKYAFARGCQRFGYRLIHFSVQTNHVHLIVEAPDAVALGRAMKGLEVRMARALNKVMRRKGPVFADRYHAHLLRSPRETSCAVRHVLENWIVHARLDHQPLPRGVDPYCSDWPDDTGPPLVALPKFLMLCVGVARRRQQFARAA